MLAAFHFLSSSHLICQFKIDCYKIILLVCFVMISSQVMKSRGKLCQVSHKIMPGNSLPEHNCSMQVQIQIKLLHRFLSQIAVKRDIQISSLTLPGSYLCCRIRKRLLIKYLFSRTGGMFKPFIVSFRGKDVLWRLTIF